jgi:hypothetical protein
VGERIDLFPLSPQPDPRTERRRSAKRDNVVYDKPLAFNLGEARWSKSWKTGKVFALTLYRLPDGPKLAISCAGERGIIPEGGGGVPQGCLINPSTRRVKTSCLADESEQAGASSCVGDIGTHAENLARYITGLEIDQVCADFTSFVKGRILEDDANMLIRFKGGAKGVLYASQISVGEENSLSIRVYGTKASLEWIRKIRRFDRKVF